MKKILIVMFLISEIINACSNNQKTSENNCKDFNINISKVLKKYGQNVEVSSSLGKTDLKLKLYFHSPSFIDPETQKLILSVLAYEMYPCYKHFKNINIDYIDQGLENDPLFYSQNIVDIDGIHERFSKNSIFCNQIKYALNNMSQQEILSCNKIIIELPKIIPNLFDFKGSFWLLLYNFSLNYNNHESKEYKNFLVFRKAASVKGSLVNPTNLSKLYEISLDNADL